MKIKIGFVRRSLTLVSIASALAAGLAACGGGGASTAASTTTATPVAAAAAGTTSSGVITAFGSVFVGGHEFGTLGTSFIDDDTGKATPPAGLEVGMVVDVKPAAGSSAAAPQAGELHIHPLARGYVDALDATAGTLTVMGQLVQLTSSTNFSDHRACVSATPATCTAVSTPGALASTSGPASPGNYVTVHGYLFSTASGAANIVATLVSVSDLPASASAIPPTGVNFKAEGVATVGTGSLAIGGLSADLSKAVCRVTGVVSPCASAFSSAQVVSVGAAAAPALPVKTLVADFARLASKTAVDVSGSAMEVEGVVSSPSSSGFVLRGVTIVTTALTSTPPQAGDVVRVLGTMDASGQSVTASSVVILHAASSVKLGLEGDATAVTAGTTTTYTLSVLGQTITVNAQTRLMDMSVKGWDQKSDPASNPFNINTFATYLATTGMSQHVIVKAETDSGGNLVANSLAIVPVSSQTGVSGLVDTTVVNSNLTGTPSTLTVHGIAISVDPAAVLVQGPKPASYPVIAAGDQVVALGTWNANTLTVAATVSRSNQLFDAGVPGAKQADRGEF